jgi:hypothetical protein
VNVHPASVQDRDGAEALLRDARRSFPFLERIIGDAGYQGQKMQAAVTRTGTWELQVVAAATGTGPSCCRKMDRRAHLGMDQPLSTAGTRLRASRSHGGRVHPPRHDPPHAASSRSNLLIRNQNLPEGLSDAACARSRSMSEPFSRARRNSRWSRGLYGVTAAARWAGR